MASHGSGPQRSDRNALRRELGQNFLQDKRVVRDLVSHVRGNGTNVLEIGPGKGAITRELVRSFETVTAVEIDPHWSAFLRDEFDDEKVEILEGDFLDYYMSRDCDTIVSNVPFNITTQVLRHLLESTEWQQAALIVQWEVARKRAGQGSGTLLSVSWAPWYEFTLHNRVPARSFRPMPRVDGGILTIRRRPRPLLPERACAAFQDFAEAVFTGPGRGLAEILRRHVPRRTYAALAQRLQIPDDGLPKDLTLVQWVALFEAARPRYATGRGPVPTGSDSSSAAARESSGRTGPVTGGKRSGSSRGKRGTPRAQGRQALGRQGARGSSYGRRTGR
ncbi:23S ribosomal RNA methyltransferase Erm [Streptomyces sp. RY43-2]|uniref:23S ribosomal RNA methyltransferase Erm n=1 Tax=Streptomyces macrolidinus TaxID=2952607 RepID=A0ABT0ZMH2_9ACTN|nr:23S ribosomal RNA methyltransferase Erm [Streptomyces macrolidinus]MCN9244791.1 23S ribosomal RNA methyltransferase Erm [Streptomyces macrolidinus]